ncbi:MAG: hypothetical protein ACYTKD_17170 [Planctomycetota bacterium]
MRNAAAGRTMRWVALAAAVCGALPACSRAREGAARAPPSGGRGGASARVIDAAQYGVRADGKTDDGPAIARMLEAALGAPGPVTLAFPKGKSIRVATAPERYVFRLDRASRVTVDGGGSTFLLAPEVRFLRLRHSRDIAFRNLNIDFDPLPFADATVTAVHPEKRCIDVRPMDWVRSPPVGGPTMQDGEQAFFGMLWYPGPYGTISRHYWIGRMEPGPDASASDVGPAPGAGPEPGTVRAHVGDDFKRFGDIKVGEWKMSLPIPGIAHRYGPGGCLDIYDNDTVTFEDVELWSAPWFGFRVMRNSGAVTFRRVHIRPKPGTGRLTSTWRDGFHVKGNSGTLLWEDCVLTGMNDDAFNISTHSSRVREVRSPTEIVVLQKFPLNPMPWREGAMLVAADFDARTLLGEARVVKVADSDETREINGKPAATPVTLELDRPVEGLGVGTMVWQPESTNPRTTLRRCRIEKSCRLQSPVTLESCEVTAFLWFYGEQVEGPFPSNVTVRDCVLRRGRGNPRMAVSFVGRRKSADGPSAVHHVTFERNKV